MIFKLKIMNTKQLNKYYKSHLSKLNKKLIINQKALADKKKELYIKIYKQEPSIELIHTWSLGEDGYILKLEDGISEENHDLLIEYSNYIDDLLNEISDYKDVLHEL